MILGNLGIIQGFSTIQIRAFSLCNKGKNYQIPCIFPVYQGICPLLKALSAHLNIWIEHRCKPTFENKRYSLFADTKKLSFRRGSNSNRVAASGHHPILNA